MRFDALIARWRWAPLVTIPVSLALAVVAIGTFVAVSTQSRDAAQVSIEQRIVSSAVGNLFAKLSDALAPNTYWDVAYDKLSDPIDAVWAQNNLGPYAAATSAVSAVLIFDSSDHLIYNYFPSDRLHRHETDVAMAAITGLVAKARQTPGTPALPATGFVPIDDHLFLGAASLVVPSDSRARGTLARHYVELYLRAFDASNLAKVESDFSVGHISIDRAAPAQMAKVSLKTASGTPAAFLVWHASTPGRSLALDVMPWALGIVALIGVLQACALYGWKDAVSALERKKAEAVHLKEEVWNRTMFLANMSHELRTPLNAIIGFSEMIAREMFGPVSERYREYADAIHSSGRHLLGIVDDVLDLTKLQNNEKLPLEPVRLSRALETGISILKEQAEQAGVYLVMKPARDDITVLANEKSLNQILINLGSNAIKSSAPGASVDIGFERQNVSERVSITVQDAGCGIPSEKLPLLGRPFYQVQSSYARRSGTGLGLAITKVLIEKMNGDLKLESTVGVGTTATVTLKAA